MDQVFYEKINSLKLKLVDSFINNGNCHDLLTIHEQLVQTPPGSQEQTVILYKKYEKLILDLTYQHETQLVNEDFQNENCVDQIKAILDVLDAMESLCQYLTTSFVNAPNNSETSKCLLWRKGALLYMYCATIYADPQRLVHVIEQPHFSQFLVDGSNYLKSMLAISAPTANEDLTCNSPDTLMLLRNGICDSTDMLALMYAGEMFFWHATLPDRSSASCVGGSNPSRDFAIQFLQKYVQLVNEPIFRKSWSCDRAKELLLKLTNESAS